jgi:Na+-transporting NADH:ubiquinone oxidoreductase subunit F
MPTIVFLNEGKAARVAEGTSVLDAALSLGVRISHVCNGGGTCSTCRVETVAGGENLSPIEPNEIAYSMGPNVRLGCQAKIRGNVGVRVLIIPKVQFY